MVDELLLLLSARPLLVALIAFGAGVVVGGFVAVAGIFWKTFR